MLKQLLKAKLTWAALGVSLLMAMLIAFSYLGAFLDPTGNTHNLPIAVVSADEGVNLGGQSLNYGQQVLSQILAPQATDAVQWTKVDSRAEAVSGLNENKYYAALVIPANYSSSLVGLAGQTATAPAQIEILTNPAAGTYAGSLAQSAAQQAVSGISKAANAQLVQKLSQAGAKVAPQLAGVLADPVQPHIEVTVPVGSHSARGLSPFYFALMLSLSAFVGTNIINILLAGLVEERRQKGQTVTSGGIFYTKALVYTLMAVLVGLLVTWVAVGWLAMDAPNVWTLGLFAILVAAATTYMSLFFQVAFGQVGLLVGLIFFTVLGVPASGGTYPVQMLPSFWQWLHTFLPLRYATDGTRALLFMGGSEEAGLGAALLVLGMYALGGLLAAWLVSQLKDRWATRTRKVRAAVAANLL